MYHDAFGRRNLVQDQGSITMRTLYDGFSFDIVQEAVERRVPWTAHNSKASFATSRNNCNFKFSLENLVGAKKVLMAYNVQEGTEQNSVSNFCKEAKVTSSIQYTQTQTGTSRYRYVGDDPKTVQYGDLTQESTRYTGSRATLYANRQAVATNRSASLYDNGRSYFGTDILGSVRSATNDYATLEDRYEYDIFGTPYEGDFTGGLNNGYTGKPYDSVTGLYNYGYRDYSPQQARFTTVDPIRDGNNWFSYVVNDPVNYVDLWGLCKTSSDQRKDLATSGTQNPYEPEEDTENMQEAEMENLIQIPLLGVRGAISVGGGATASLFLNPNNWTDSGIALTTMAGTGVDVGIDTPLNPLIEGLLNIGASNINTAGPKSSADIEGTRTAVSVGVIGGLNYDVESKSVSGDFGNVGGGVYETVTDVITVDDVIDYLKEWIFWK